MEVLITKTTLDGRQRIHRIYIESPEDWLMDSEYKIRPVFCLCTSAPDVACQIIIESFPFPVVTTIRV